MDEFHNCNVYNKENFFCILKYYLFPKSLNLSYVEMLAIIIYLDVYLHLDLLTCNDLFIIPLNKSNNCQSIFSRFSFFLITAKYISMEGIVLVGQVRLIMPFA